MHKVLNETTVSTNYEFLAYTNSVHFTPQQSSCKNGNTNEQYNLPSCATCEIIRTNMYHTKICIITVTCTCLFE